MTGGEMSIPQLSLATVQDLDLGALPEDVREALFQKVVNELALRPMDLNPTSGELDPITQQLCNTVFHAAGDYGFVHRDIFQKRLEAGFGINVSTEGIVLAYHPDTHLAHALLVQAGDVYQGLWCNAGKIAVKGISTPQRLQQINGNEETGLRIAEDAWTYAGVVECLDDPRGESNKLGGHWMCITYYTIISWPAATYHGTFFPTNKLPRELVWSHRYGMFRLLNYRYQTGRSSSLHIRCPGDTLAWIGGPSKNQWDDFLPE